MNITEEFLDFCNEFLLYNHYYFEKVVKLNHIRDQIVIVLSESDFDGKIITLE